MTVKQSWLRSLSAAVVLGAVGTAAHAAPYFDSPSLAPRMIPPSFQYWHDITDQGYNNAAEDIDSATLRIFLADDGDNDQGYIEWFLIFPYWVPGETENATFVLDGVNWVPSDSEVDGSTSNYDWFSTSVSNYLDDGRLLVTIGSSNGDFWFKKSELTVNTRPVSVPEPATLGLMGLGLVGLGLARRRKAMKA